jgi:hypothetical protein
MIELERDESQDIQVWADKDFVHVIVQETEETVRIGFAPGWYVRDEGGEMGAFEDFALALGVAGDTWGEVTLAPASRLRDAVEVEDENDVGNYLLEYLAKYGTAGIDAQALAKRVFERIEES